MERLKEGAAKRVPPQRLLSVLQRDFARLRRVIRLIEEAGFRRATRSSRYQKNIKLLSIVLRGDISEAVVTELLEYAGNRGKTLDEAATACNAIFQVARISSLGDTDLVRLGKSLLTSRLPASSYASVASLFLKGKVNKMDDSDIVELMVRVLENGGGLIQLERELQRRARR
jgi:hypothetical protein